jgi:hypothetical protein
MGGYKVIAPGEGEVKSMHVTQAARGQGAGARILDDDPQPCARARA